LKVVSLVDFSGVPKGTIGTAEVDGKRFKITWDLPNRAVPVVVKPLVDWFSKEDYDRFLKEI
jgi:hypothetical protein